MSSQRIALVRKYFEELEIAAKKQKKMKTSKVLDIFHLIDCALANGLITPHECKAFDKFVKGKALESRFVDIDGTRKRKEYRSERL